MAAGVALAGLGAGIGIGTIRPVRADTSGGASDLDERDGWTTYVDGSGNINYVLDRVATDTPRGGGSALRLAITGGDPYMGILSSYRVATTDDASSFHLSFAWRFSATSFGNQGRPSVVQAGEFAINHWTPGARYEWALQWQNVTDGSPETGTLPDWRLWDGPAQRWRTTGFAQRLTPEQWHTLVIEGTKTGDGMLRYDRFVSDGAEVPLGNSYAPVAAQGDGTITVAFQIDGNYVEAPYTVLFDGVDIAWQWRVIAAATRGIGAMNDGTAQEEHLRSGSDRYGHADDRRSSAGRTRGAGDRAPLPAACLVGTGDDGDVLRLE